MTVYYFNGKISSRVEKKLFESDFMQFISAKDQKYIYSFKKIEDRCNRLIGRFLISMWLQDLNLDINSINLEFNKFKKPFIAEYQQLYFNISHSNSTTVFIGSQLGKIGIDIEHIDSFINIKSTHSIFSNEEIRFIQSCNNVPFEFYKIWTRKEALFKANGMGFYHPLLKIINVKDDVVYLDQEYYKLRTIYLKNSEECLSLAHSFKITENLNLKVLSEDYFLKILK